MVNVYIDPNSHIYLQNGLFKEKDIRESDVSLPFWRFLKEFCSAKGISLFTIDALHKSKASDKDIYVSFEHKNFLKRVYWHMKNKNYPVRLNLAKFKKRILIQFECPFIMPEVYANMENISASYDTAFFSYKVNHVKVGYVHYWQAYDTILQEYWNKTDRKFLVMINSWSAKKSWKKLLFVFFSTGRYPGADTKELISERERALDFFSKTSEIDLYGSGWQKLPNVQNVYKGRAESKYAALSSYTFCICYENSEFLGYITEKIFDCLYTGTIPIYLGAPDIKEYIPKECFIDMRKFKDFQALRTFLKSLSKEQIQEYKENGRTYLQSEQYKQFTQERFAEIFAKECLNKA